MGSERSAVVAGLACLAVLVIVVTVAAALWVGSAEQRAGTQLATSTSGRLLEVPGSSTATSASLDDGLRVYVQRPASLRPGSVQQLRIDVRAPGSTPLSPTEQLEVEVTVDDGSAAARGAVWATPSRTMVSAGELPWRRFQLGSIVTAPCGVELGQLRVNVRDLREDGLEGEAVVAVPRASCETDGPPIAPDGVHIEDPVCGETWREDLAALVAGRTRAATWCRTDPGRGASRAATPPPSTAPRAPSPPDPAPAPGGGAAHPKPEPAPVPDPPEPETVPEPEPIDEPEPVEEEPPPADTGGDPAPPPVESPDPPDDGAGNGDGDGNGGGNGDGGGGGAGDGGNDGGDQPAPPPEGRSDRSAEAAGGDPDEDG